LLVGAASDLAPLEVSLSRALPGCTIRFSFGSSGMLSQQIQHGADFDVFLSASERYIDELVRTRAVDPDSKLLYAQGRIAWWSAKNLKFEDVRKVRNLSIANPDHAPYGQAAKEALVSQGIWEGIRSRTVYGENVRQALQFAQTGNADGALVAWSLVKDKGGSLLPAEWHKPITQSAAIPVRSRNKEAAKKLLMFLLSPEGRKILAQSGFFPAPTTLQSRPASPAR
jgi:molybdate transport system substrate-binding protein